MNTNINRYDTYHNVISSYLTAIGQLSLATEYALLLKFWSDILPLVEYMLFGRFQNPLPTKTKSTKVVKPMSPELRYILADGVVPEVPQLVNVLDMIKFFKMLENYILSRVWMLDIKELELGKYSEQCANVMNSLSILLKSVHSLELSHRARYLNIIFSIISIYRLFKCKTTADLSTVISEYTGTADLKDVATRYFSGPMLVAWVDSFLANFNLSKHTIQLTIYSGNASSPNGGPSTNALIRDLWAVYNDKSLFNAIKQMAGYFHNGKEIMDIINAVVDCRDIIEGEEVNPFAKYNSADLVHSKLIHFTDKGGKSRVIAIVDWITQSVLSGIHYTLFAILKSVPSDYTFDHKEAIDKILEYGNDNKLTGYTYFSIDLKAATDRMPRVLQSAVLAAILNKLGMPGDAIAKCWLRILDRVFKCDDSIPKHTTAKYAVGQPMGSFTSWTALAITHHYIVNCIIGIPMTRYAIVGDDLVFYGTQSEFDRYTEFMNSIGCIVSAGKTIVSPSVERPTAEFARSFWVDGCKITPIPFGMIYGWLDGKIAFETVLYNLVQQVSLPDLVTLMTRIHSSLLPLEVAILGYYLVRHELALFKDVLAHLSGIVTLPKWFTERTITLIGQACLSTVGNKSAMLFTRASTFMSTFNSQFVVRDPADVTEARQLYFDITNILLANADLLDICNTIQARLAGAEVAIFSTEITGGPLLTRKERNVIVEINDREIKLSKVRKSRITKKE